MRYLITTHLEVMDEKRDYLPEVVQIKFEVTASSKGQAVANAMDQVDTEAAKQGKPWYTPSLFLHRVDVLTLD